MLTYNISDIIIYIMLSDELTPTELNRAYAEYDLAESVRRLAVRLGRMPLKSEVAGDLMDTKNVHHPRALSTIILGIASAVGYGANNQQGLVRFAERHGVQQAVIVDGQLFPDHSDTTEE
jgi:hypothetical protein